MDGFWTALSGLVAVAAFVLALIAYLQGRERLIGWATDRSNVRDADHRIINLSRGLVAEVVDLRTNGLGPRFAPRLPAEILPQNWVPIGVHQLMEGEPIAVTITWRQKKLGQAEFKKGLYQATIYF